MHPGKKINNKEAQKRFWSGKEEAEKKKQRPSLSTGVKDKKTSTFDGRQLLIKNVSPIKSLPVLSHVLSMAKSFVGFPQDDEEHDVCRDKNPKSCL